MKIARMIVAAAAALAITGSAAFAQDMRAGTVTRIDRISGTVAIQQTQSGTVGANSGGATEQFKVQDGNWLNSLHAGDRVTFSTTETAGTRTITKLDKQ